MSQSPIQSSMGDSCCQREIDVQALEVRQRRTLLIVLGINIVTFLLMVAAAIHARSSRSEEHTPELPILMRISYAVFCLIKKIYHHTPPKITKFHHLLSLLSQTLGP